MSEIRGIQPSPSSEVAFISEVDALVVPKQTLGEFLATELFVYLSQVLMFFFVAVLTSNLLRDEGHLVSYVSSKINGGMIYEICAIMIAIAATLGIITAITTAVPASPLLKRVADEVLAETSRAAYVFGSAAAGTLLAVALYVRIHPQPEGVHWTYAVGVAAMWALLGFLYGCFFSYAFKHKALVKSIVSSSARVPSDS